MDMYRILENFDAVNSKKTLVEGRMSVSAIDELYQEWVNSEDAPFDSDSGDQNAVLEKAMRFLNGRVRPEQIEDIADMLANHWHGGQGVMSEERRSEEDWDAQAVAQQKAKLAREKQKIMMQRKISGQDSGEPPVVRDMSEADMEEGNKFAYNVLKAKAAGKKQADLDGDGDMERVQEVFPGTTEYELRFGKDDAASAFDKKKISTGTVYSRRYRDEPESDDDAPKSAGRPKGTGRKLGAKGPSVASKLLKGKGGLKEHDDVSIMDQGEYNDEAGMARQDLHTMVDAARELHAILASDENLPEWVQSKITKALDYIDTARDYVKSSHAERSEQPVAEIAPVIGAIAGRALAGAAGAGSTGQALGGLAGRAVAGAMSDDSVEEAGYSAKAARAGKDIGKPGKNFAKIAKGAAERYGSKEAGERVAGAVLAKLRAKEGIEEESTETKDRHAEKAGKKVTKDLEYDMKHKGKDDAKAEKAGKKVTKDIEYDDKKDKKKEVEETTVSGSVAPAAGGTAPKKGKGGMQFGKGVYEGQLDELDKSTLGSYVKKSKVDMVKGALAGASGAAAGDSGETDKAQKQVLKRNSGINKAIDRLTKEGVYEGQVAESFEKKLGSILNEGMSVNVSTDDTGKKSISVNATDSDADALGDMLKMAGLFSSEGYSRTCEHCHGIHEAGACGVEQVEEELANSPDEVYTDADYMTQTLSGGLNGPKTTGQTTGPVVNRQDSRQGVMAEAERVKEQAESRLWNLYKKI